MLSRNCLRPPVKHFLTFADQPGLVETAFFPAAYRRSAMMLNWERSYLMAGKAEENFEAATLNVAQAGGW